MILRYILIFLFLFITLPTYSKESKFEKKLQKDLKKLSKFSGFIDNNLKLYDEDSISDFKKSIVIIYNHGSDDGEAKLDHCNKGSMNVPEVISNLHNQEIKGLTIKIYRMCSGVRGLIEPQWVRVHDLWRQDGNVNGFIELIDYDGVKIYDKLKQTNKRKIILDKVNELIESGFENIVLAGHSCGAWATLNLTGRFHDKIKGSIAMNPACRGRISDRTKKNPWPAWSAYDDYEVDKFMKLSEINSLVFIHDKDPWENSETLSFLNNINKIQIINYTNFECKGKFGANAHYHPVYPKEDNCFAKWEAKNNYIVNYLESIF